MFNLKHSIHLWHYVLWNIVMAYKLQLSKWKGVITNYRLVGCGALQFGRQLQNFLLSCRQRRQVPWNIARFLISLKMAMSTITTWHTCLNFLYKKNGLKRGMFMLLSTDTITTVVLNCKREKCNKVFCVTYSVTIKISGNNLWKLLPFKYFNPHSKLITTLLSSVFQRKISNRTHPLLYYIN